MLDALDRDRRHIIPDTTDRGELFDLRHLREALDDSRTGLWLDLQRTQSPNAASFRPRPEPNPVAFDDARSLEPGDACNHRRTRNTEPFRKRGRRQSGVGLQQGEQPPIQFVEPVGHVIITEKYVIATIIRQLLTIFPLQHDNAAVHTAGPVPTEMATDSLPETRFMHQPPLEIRCPPLPTDVPPSGDVSSEHFVAAAATFASTLPSELVNAIAAFRAESHPSGALLVRGLPVGTVPATPEQPTAPTPKDAVSERSLLAIATILGEPVGYRPELGGRLVQNLVPTRDNQDRQTSTSSTVPLLFHTETAFHPYRPAYLVLLCLRGDPAADTTLSSIHEVWPRLSPRTRDILFEPRFRTAIDESFLNGRENVLGAPMPVLRDRTNPSMVFDEDLMVGIDAEANAALAELGRVTTAFHARINLGPGDLLVIDNARAVHGRSPYTPRFDGSDRWLQRTFVIAELPTNSIDLDGRVITTPFGRTRAA